MKKVPLYPRDAVLARYIRCGPVSVGVSVCPSQADILTNG